jgi:hexulose-6-phosphate isomerase
MTGLKRAVKLNMYASSGSFAERFDDLASVGLDGVEIGFHDGLPIAEILRASRTSGLQVPTLIVGTTFEASLTSPNALERTTAADAVLNAIDGANALDCGAVMINPGWDRDDLHPSDTAAIVRDALSGALRAAETADVTIAIENLWNGWLTSATALAAFIDSFASANVGVLFDSGNAARFSAPQHWIRTLGHRIVRFDVKDYKKAWALRPATVYAPDDELRAVWGEDGPWGALDALLFEGDVSWPLVASALDEIGYDGWTCAEHGAGDLEWIQLFATDLERLNELIATKGWTS